MKKSKTFIVCIMAAFFTLSAAACGGQESPGGSNSGGGDGRPSGTLTIRIVNKGYGMEWLKQIAAAYEDDNPGAEVKILESNDPAAVASKAQSASNDADIIVSTNNFFQLQFGDYLVDISDVYNSVQEGYEEPLKDRMNQSFRDYFETGDGKFYQMSWVETYGGYLYNKTELDKAYGGEENYKLPNTTDEMIAMCAELKNNKDFEPIALSTSQSYYDLIKYTWFAQYEGLEKLNNILRGYYKNAAGEYVPCTTTAEFTKMIDAPARTKVYQTIIDLIGKGNYAHSESDKMNFTDSQNAFLGLGYGSNMKKCAFYLIGDWFATEMAASLQNSGADVRFMKTIVLSDITETLEDTSMTDEELSALIDAIDEGKTATEAGVSENDYNRVKEARYSSHSAGIDHCIAVPKLKKGGAQYAFAKDFLKFMVTDEAQVLFAQAQNGLSMPYGYDVTRLETEYGIPLNNYAKSIIEAKGDGMMLVANGGNTLFGRSFPLFVGYFENAAFKGTQTAASAIASIDSSYSIEEVLKLIAK